MPRTHVSYPPEFRRDAIRLVRSSGKPLTQIAQQLEISHETLRAWVKQADIDDGLRHDGLTTEETEEMRQPRREVSRLPRAARNIQDDLVPV